MSSFGQLIHQYCQPLDWGIQDLARESGVSRLLLQAWSQNGPDRRLTHKHIYDIAFALTRGSDAVKINVQVQQIVNRLLNSVELGELESPDRDRSWRRIASSDRRILRIGTLEKAYSREVESSAMDAMKEVGWRLNLQLSFLPGGMNDLVQSLLNHRIDAIGPFLPITPAAVSKLSFSEPVELAGAFRWGFSILTPSSLSDTAPPTVHVVEGDPGICAHRVLLRRRYRSSADFAPPLVHQSIQEAREFFEDPQFDKDGNCTACLAVSDVVLEPARQQSPHLQPAPGLAFSFDVGFAVHPNEQELLRLINLCCRQAHFLKQPALH